MSLVLLLQLLLLLLQPPTQTLSRINFRIGTLQVFHIDWLSGAKWICKLTIMSAINPRSTPGIASTATNSTSTDYDIVLRFEGRLYLYIG